MPKINNTTVVSTMLGVALLALILNFGADIPGVREVRRGLGG